MKLNTKINFSVIVLGIESLFLIYSLAFLTGLDQYYGKTNRLIRSSYELTLDNIDEFLDEAEEMITQIGVNFNIIYDYYEKLVSICLSEPFISLESLKLPQETEEFLWSISDRAEFILKQYEDYLTSNFNNLLAGVEIPFPLEYLDSIWQGQAEFANDFSEFIENIKKGFIWIKRFKNDKINGIDYRWIEVPNACLRMMIDLGLREKEKKFLVRRNMLYEKFEVFGNRALNGFLPRFDDFFALQVELKLFPKNFKQWLDYIILAKTTGGGIDLRIIEQNVMNPFIQLHFLKQGAREKGKIVYDFVKVRSFYEKYIFLNNETLSFLYKGYDEKIFDLRTKLEIPPDTVEEWNQLLELGIRIWWNEVKDEDKLKLIEIRTNQNAIDVSERQLANAHLMGLMFHYGGINRFRNLLIIPQLAKRIVGKYISTGEIDWESLDTRVLIEAQIELIEIGADSLTVRLSEFLDSKENFKILIPELGNRNLESLISYWGGWRELIEGLNLEKSLYSQFNSEDYQIYGTYWAIILIIDISRQLDFLHERAEFNPININNIAWEGSFGSNTLERAIKALEEIDKPLSYYREADIASRIIHPILNYLAQRNIINVVGIDSFNRLFSRLNTQISWISKLLKKHRALQDKDSLLKQLEEEIEF